MTLTIRQFGWKRTALAGMSIMLAGALAAGCSAKAADGGTKSVKVAAVATQQADDKVEQDADVVSSSQVSVITKTGGDVAEVLKKRGDTVQQGEIIFRIDSSDAERNREKNQLSRANLQAQIDKNTVDIATNKSVLRNTIEKLQLQIADLQKAYNNARNDYDAGLVNKSQVEKAETQIKTAQLDLDTAQKQLANLENTDPLAPLRTQIQSTDVAMQDIEKSLSDFNVKAPISGILTELTPEQGVTVPAGYVAGQIQQTNPIKVHADLTEAEMKYVRGKTEVSFTLPNSTETLKGTVQYLADVMSPQSKTYVLELTVPNSDQKLKSGMRVKLQLGGDAKQTVVVVPTASIVKDGNDSYVYIVAGDQAEKRKVTLGRTWETNREALSGVKAGEQLVVLGQQELKDKDRVVVKQ